MALARLWPTMGAEVTVFTTDMDKVAEAEKLGARVVVEGDKQAYAKLANSFDFILSTIPKKHKVDPFIPPLKRNATY